MPSTALTIKTTRSTASRVLGEVLVQLRPNWPDYVFKSGYHLLPIKELSDYLVKNQHLPHFKSASELNSGHVAIGETQMQLLKTIEEQALYIIQLDKRISDLEKQESKK